MGRILGGFVLLAVLAGCTGGGVSVGYSTGWWGWDDDPDVIVVNPDRPDHPDRPERPDRPDRPERPPHAKPLPAHPKPGGGGHIGGGGHAGGGHLGGGGLRR